MKKDRLFHYFYKWLANFKNANMCDVEKIICFCNEKYHAHVTFHQEFETIELSIIDKLTNQNVFYLHFEVKDFWMCRNNIISFFRFLKGEEKLSNQSSTLNLSPIKILITCTSGFTSSYFASLMQETFDKNEITVFIDACPISELDNVVKDYDIVLLAPQVSYVYIPLKKKFGKKIMQIDAMDFATGNVNKTLQSIFA